MHTVILTLISLLVPLITAQIGDDPPVVPPILRPSVWPLPLPSPYYWGDMLNITKCYCEGDNDATAGHYYQFDYRNYHNEQAYRVAWTCEKDATTTGEATVKGKRVSFPVPECWTAQAAWRSKKRKECVKSVYADTFCFELGNSKDPVDHYYFDEEKRGLPNFGIVEYPPDQCVALCRDKVGGKAVASDTKGGWEKSLPSSDNRLTTLRSSFQSYTALDDMCPIYHDMPVACNTETFARD